MRIARPYLPLGVLRHPSYSLPVTVLPLPVTAPPLLITRYSLLTPPLLITRYHLHPRYSLLTPPPLRVAPMNLLSLMLSDSTSFRAVVSAEGSSCPMKWSSSPMMR